MACPRSWTLAGGKGRHGLCRCLHGKILVAEERFEG